MKIAQQALVLAIGTSTLVQGHSFRKNVDSSKIDMRFLMENAKSSTKTKRDLQEADLTGYDSIIFKSCQTLSVETNSDSNTVQTLVASGAAKGVQSYVEFDVCDSQFCTQEGSRTSYVVPLSDYMNAFSEFLPTKQAEYCEGCINNNDYCQIQYYPNTNVEMPTQYYYDQYVQNNGGRRLAQNGVFYEAINCDLCRSYNCMYTENEEYNNRIAWTQENSKSWIQSMTSCYQNPNRPVIVNQDTEASFAFVCNAEGTGVEIGVFLDSDCTIYDSQIHFGSVMGQSDYYFFTQSKANVEFIFENSFSCYNPEITYVSPEQYQNYAAQQGNQGQNGEAPEAGEWCTNVFGGNTAPMEFTSCNVTTIDDWAQVDAGESSALSQNDLKDLTAACAYLTAHNGTGQAIYNKKGSGSMYTWSSSSSKAGSSITSSGNSTNATATGDMESTASSWWNFWGSGSASSSTATDSASANRNWKSTLSKMAEDTSANAARTAKAGAKLGTAGIVGIVLAVVVVGSAIAALTYRQVKKDKTGSKEEPMLEKEGTGTLA
jgi:hypothetical protein